MKKIITILLSLLLMGCALLEPPQPVSDATEIDIESILSDVEEVDEEIEIVEEILVDTEEIEEEAEEAETEVEETTVKETPVLVVIEGEEASFPKLKVTDPDGDVIKYTYSEPLDYQGTWQTREGDAGEYLTSITASDGENDVTQEVLIIVEALNKPPVIALFSDVVVKEGDKIKLNPDVTDPEGEEVTVTFTGWMDTDSRKTTFDDAGEYIIRITASDGVKESYQDVKITVENVNRAPVFENIV